MTTTNSAATQILEKINKDVTNITTQINTYKGLFLNFTNIIELYEKYKVENAALLIKFKNLADDTLTNDRKTYYEDQKITDLKNFYFYFILTVYIIFVIAFAIFSLTYPSDTNIKIKIGVFILLIILPFISTWILGMLIYLFYEIYNTLPKNVYK